MCTGWAFYPRVGEWVTRRELAVGSDSRSVSTAPSQMFSVASEEYHVGYSREFVDTVYCAYGQSDTTIVLWLIS